MKIARAKAKEAREEMKNSMQIDSSLISFRPMNEADVVTLYRWLTDPELIHIWLHDKPVTFEEVERNYLPRIRGQEPIQPFFVLFDDEPIGYIQTYRWRDRIDYARHLPVEDIETAVGVDVFIGEQAYRNRGFGPLLLRRFLSAVVFRDPHVTSCVITPEHWNQRAIQAYKKAGFHQIGVYAHPDEPSKITILRFDRRQLWQPGAFSSADRYAVANRVVDRLREKYGESLLAVALEGSTAKGLDVPYSDVELRVILSDEVGVHHRWYAFTTNGMSVGISYSSFSRMFARANDVTYEWPKAGDGLMTCQVLYDPAGIFQRLRAQAEEAECRADFQTLVRDALCDMYESVLKLFSVPDDALSLRMDAGMLAYWAAMAVGLANRHRYSSSRRMFEESFTLPDLPEHYETCISALLAMESDASRIRQYAGLLWNASLAWAVGLGIHIEDDELSDL
jgi:kanamycin nucleotidyltransferase